MLVYGDREHSEFCAPVRSLIADRMAKVIDMPPGRLRHEQLVQVFMMTSELVQGVLDQRFDADGADDLSEAQAAGGQLLLAQAQAVIRSWQAGFAGTLAISADWRAWLDRLDSAHEVRMKGAEGYAFYALYPEAYAEAARRSGLGPDTVVIGLRSIGAGLSAIVAAALGANPAYTFRPAGHPFARELRVGKQLADRILADPHADFAIVDEGPGLSGSSFSGVADWLEGNGIAPQRIHFFPSHGGDMGPQARHEHRARWQARPRHVAGMDELIMDASEPAHCLRTWVEDVIGSGISDVHDISGGWWRTAHPVADAHWPPCDTQMEKRKFLMTSGDQAWLVKFSGLGDLTADKARRGRMLSEAGFTPEVAGHAYGFLIQRWAEGSPLSLADVDRHRLIDTAGRYLGFRARHLSPGRPGASLDALVHMAVFNTQQALGVDAAPVLEPLTGNGLSGRLRPIDSDNRMHRWEWLVTDDGHIVKTDALDHNAAHDLIGCQDVAWDIAGACVEFDMTPAERDRFIETVSREAGYDADAGCLAAFEVFYLAFQIGLWTNARATADDADAGRIQTLLDGYKDRLRGLVTQ